MADGFGMNDDEWKQLSSMVEDTFWVMRVIGERFTTYYP